MRKLKKIFPAIIALALVLVSILPTSAQQNEPGSGISISPLISEFTLKPGEAKTLELKLKNITSNKITAQPSINDFESDNESGNPKIITDPNYVGPHSISKFITGLEDVPLNSGEQKKVDLPVQVPKDTTPGAYYGIIRYKAVPVGENEPGPNEVSLSASVGSIVLITVPGDLREQAQLTNIQIYRGDGESTLFFRKPTKVGVELKNLGNAFIKPFGTVEIRDIRGKEVYSYQLNNTDPRASVLPDSTRIFVNDIKNVDKIGRYTVTASVSYGNGSQVLTLKKTFWYIPLWLAVVILMVLAVLVYLTFRAYRRYKLDRKRAYRRRG